MKQYEKIPIQKPKASVFDLSHEAKLSMNMGELVPIICQEVIPGDNFRLSYEAIVKLQPILTPIMHRVNVFAHFFFVQIVWFGRIGKILLQVVLMVIYLPIFQSL